MVRLAPIIVPLGFGGTLLGVELIRQIYEEHSTNVEQHKAWVIDAKNNYTRYSCDIYQKESYSPITLTMPFLDPDQFARLSNDIDHNIKRCQEWKAIMDTSKPRLAKVRFEELLCEIVLEPPKHLIDFAMKVVGKSQKYMQD